MMRSRGINLLLSCALLLAGVVTFPPGTANATCTVSSTVAALAVGAVVNDRCDTFNNSAIRQGTLPTYAAALTLKTATAAGVTPFFSVCGSATKTVRVQRVSIDYTVATLGIHGDLRLQKTSTATSAGTPTTLTQTPMDSQYGAGTATLVNFYTVLATAGALVGTVDVQQVWGQITATVTAGSEQTRSFVFRSASDAEAVVLRGTAQCLEASFGTTPTNAPTMTVSTLWTEE